MIETIKTKDGEPFASEHAAKIQQGVLRNKGTDTRVVQEGDGWVLQHDIPDTTPRPKRIPLGTRNVLKYPERKGYVRRVVNDVDDRILRYEQAGYEVVQSKDLPSGDRRAGDASQIGMPVSKPVGGGIKGVLMEIKEEWYKEDQIAKQAGISAFEENINRPGGNVEGGYGSVSIGDR